MISSIAVYTIVTICNAGDLNDCRKFVGFGDMRPGYTAETCERESIALAEKFLVGSRKYSHFFVSGASCNLNEERGA